LFLKLEKTMPRFFSPEERLDILRAGDRLRKWRSLHDKRVCMLCEEVITGHQIEIRRDQRGRYLLKCPTQGCPAMAAHWVYEGDYPYFVTGNAGLLRAALGCESYFSVAR
jgi:hypothetical protein